MMINNNKWNRNNIDNICNNSNISNECNNNRCNKNNK